MIIHDDKLSDLVEHIMNKINMKEAPSNTKTYDAQGVSCEIVDGKIHIELSLGSGETCAIQATVDEAETIMDIVYNRYGDTIVGDITIFDSSVDTGAWIICTTLMYKRDGKITKIEIGEDLGATLVGELAKAINDIGE